ncbi:acetylornithine transaminase [Curtobacterium sp. MCBD17_034]|uniref:acetylornithine transaminase n=1 Tax=unclassified Curtobacterium TaxID=257496 RepID=UPI000DA8C2A3|nr:MULTISPECIES: acetylornithine transaminase [unclassified Curtobacterium]PZE73550.1 acetylornithine transaminase [Curtobacterium sp. MCBD17_019]PZF56553.1 acetylornithine transaminase [Curtobacterium sp. MCBD17_034]PZF60569.1 acetylornithine transaminase [Curtobacterium sp. MCBD17_013]PZM33737.1 acetylornithine transaminase [Curtobacterium sp. MCBD17_031]WIE55524.1 acetylornithine transaminase [Curtobacterium sp. MCBD17_003]
MSMTTQTGWNDRFGASLMRSLTPPKIMLERGRGCRVWDVDGKEYLDFLAGIAVNSLGHAHPAVVEAVTDQASKLMHVSNYFATPPQLELAERLKRITGAGDAGRVYFGNSGAEANEAAFKLARLNKGDGSRTRILALQNSFHGRTMGALALTGKPALREDFEPMIPGVEHIDSTIEALEAAIDDHVAALVLEPIKGEAGVVDLPEGFLAAARALTEQHGALLILDEIQTGVGRTGSWFAFQGHGITPDAITIAKGIAGGFPIGALVTFGWASDLFSAGQHGSTFGGNPLATRVANAVLGEIETTGLVEAARGKGERIRAGIAAIGSPLVDEVRGEGLLVGIGLTRPVAPAINTAALERGLIVNAPNESSIRIAPPLIVSDAEIDEFLVILAQAMEAAA